MNAQLPTAKIVDLTTTLDARPKLTASGVVLWASVELVYASPGASPKVTIRVPLPWSPEESEAERSHLALRAARQLIDHACVAMTGQTPIQLLNARILLEAKRQLLYTSQPIGRIAYTLGFDDAAYFTRFFSRRAGLSPRAFRTRGADRALASD